MLNILFLVVLAVTVSYKPCAATPFYCSATGQTVDCYDYDLFAITQHSAGYQECRLKFIDDQGNNQNKEGIVLYRYQDAGDAKRDTEACSYYQGATLTESPDINALDHSYYSDNYIECCAKKVIDRCFYKAVLHMDCGSSSTRTDDAIEKIVVTYRTDVNVPNQSYRKEVTVELRAVDDDPNDSGDYPQIWCTNNFSSVTNFHKQIKASVDTDKLYYCGDSDIVVSIKRFPHPTEYGIMLKASRYKCNSQYASFFPNSLGELKYKVRSAINRNSVDYYEEVKTAPVIAETKYGLCGSMVYDVSPPSQQY